VVHFNTLKMHQNRSPFVIDFSGDKGIDVLPLSNDLPLPKEFRLLTRKYSIIVVLAFVSSAMAISLLHGQNAKTQAPTQLQTQVNPDGLDVPIADFNAPEPTNPTERAKRELRSKRHNLRDKGVTSENSAQFILREDKPSPGLPETGKKRSTPTQQPVSRNTKSDYNSPVIGGAVTDESPSEQPLPTYISDAVVIGSVTNAKAYLSQDKTAVYSEFTVQVWDVLKNSQASPLAVGSGVTVLRPGGGVRFPSGKVRKFLVAGRGLPRTGERYAFFLKYDDLAQAYYIVTAYELLGGKVFPLDGIPQYGTSAHPFASYSKYANADEGAFLVEVRNAVIHPPPQAPSGFPISPTGTPNGVGKQ
jgi:hypothetical protein